MPHRHDAFDCFALDRKPKEKARPGSADVRCLGAREPRVDELPLPKFFESRNLSLIKTVIRWMSVESTTMPAARA